MSYTPNVAVGSVEAKLLRKDVKACPILRGIICDGITEVIAEVIVVQNRDELCR